MPLQPHAELQPAGASEASTQSAARAGGRRLVAQQRAPEVLVALAIPNLAQALLGRIAEREAVIAAHREGGDAAGQRLAVRRKVHQCPRPAAERPRLLLAVSFEARSGLARTRGIERDAEAPGQFLGLAQALALVSVELLEQGRFRTRQTLALPKIDEALQINLENADLVREPHKGGELADRFLEPGQPERNARRLLPLFALHRDESAKVAHDPLEHVAPAHQRERLGFRRVEGNAKLVQSGIDQLLAPAAGEEGPRRG